MPITGGFGTRFDVATGCARAWYMARDGVKRWADNDAPCDPPRDETVRGALEGHTNA